MSMESTQIMELIQHETADIFRDQRGLIWFKFNVKATVDILDAHEYVPIIEQLAQNQKRGFVLDARGGFATFSQASRNYMGKTPEALKWRKADAVLVDNLGLRLVGNFYMKFDTPNHPVKLFKSEIAALEWLSQFD